MSLKNTIRKAVRSAFKALDDIPQTVEYKAYTGAIIRDIAAGTSTKAAQNYTLKQVVFTKITVKDVDRFPDVLLKDMKILFPSEDLAVEPKAEDIVTDATGKIWTIKKIMSDPAAVLIIAAVRTT